MPNPKSFRTISITLLALALIGCASIPEPTAGKSSLMLFYFPESRSPNDQKTSISWAETVVVDGPEALTVARSGPRGRLAAVSVTPGTYHITRRILSFPGHVGKRNEQSEEIQKSVNVPPDSVVLIPLRFGTEGYSADSLKAATGDIKERDLEIVAAELSDTVAFSVWIDKLFIGFGAHSPRITLSQDEYKTRIVSDPPGARVIIDDEARGYTPTTVDVKMGKHLVEVRKDGFSAWRSYVEIDSDLEISMSLKTIFQVATDYGGIDLIKPNQYGLLIMPFRNVGGAGEENLRDVFHQSLAAMLSRDPRIHLLSAPEVAARPIGEPTAFFPDFTTPSELGADLLVSGDYYAEEGSVFIHATLFDVQKEGAKADMLYVGATGVSLFGSIDEMTRRFGEAVDHALPEAGRQIIERKEIRSMEITSFERRATEKDVIQKRSARKHDLSVVSGVSSIIDYVDVPDAEPPYALRQENAAPLGLGVSYTYRFNPSFGFFFQYDIASFGEGEKGGSSGPAEQAILGGLEITFPGRSLDLYTRVLWQYRSAASLTIDTNEDKGLDDSEQFDTGTFRYYGFSVDTGVKRYLNKRYSAPGWYATAGFRLSPFLVREGEKEPNDGPETVPLEMFIYAGAGVRL